MAKSQSSVFAVLTLVILTCLLFIVLVMNLSRSSAADIISATAVMQRAEKSIESCAQKAAYAGLWAHGRNEYKLRDHLSSEIPSCVNWRSLDEKVSIVRGTISVDVVIRDNSIVVAIDYPFIVRKDGSVAKAAPIHVEVPLAGQVYSHEKLLCPDGRSLLEANRSLAANCTIVQNPDRFRLPFAGAVMYDFSPEIEISGTLSLQYFQGLLYPDQKEQDLRIAYLDNGRWAQLNTRIDKDRDIASANISRLSSFALIALRTPKCQECTLCSNLTREECMSRDVCTSGYRRDFSGSSMVPECRFDLYCSEGGSCRHVCCDETACPSLGSYACLAQDSCILRTEGEVAVCEALAS